MDYQYLATNTERLRKQRDLNINELCERAGISAPAYRSIREGAAEPRQRTIKAIARRLGVSYDELVQAPPQLDILYNDKEFKDFEKNQIKYEIEERLKKYRSLYEKLGKNQPQSELLPKLQKFYKNNKCPKALAKKAREELKLGDSPILDIVHLFIHKLKVEVIPFHSGFDIFSASIPSNNEGGAAICVNISSSITAERQIFSCAHELGHLIRGKGKCYSSEDKNELDVFAGNFLAPEDEVIQKLEECKGLHIIDQIIQVKNHFSVSYRSILHRVSEKTGHDYQKLKQSFIDQYYDREGKILKDKDEPSPVPALKFKGDKLEALVREAFECRKVTSREAAEILEISEYMFDEIKNSWKLFSIS